MLSEIVGRVEDVNLAFQNEPIRVVVLKPVPRIEVAGRVIEPLEEGVEVELPMWVADRLEESGYVKPITSGELTLVELTKVHWRESLPKSRSVSTLPPDFYCKLRRMLGELKVKGQKDLEKLKEYEKAASISNDILTCRLKKIVSLASSQYQTEEVKRGLASEERILLEEISKLIKDWRESVLEAHG
ncbi:MAG: hypothetical protein QXO32_08990 [Candidatus Bathyarchaeia archaeon]